MRNTKMLLLRKTLNDGKLLTFFFNLNLEDHHIDDKTKNK